MESNLQTSFQLAQTYDCVMLLCEADIFLAERTPADIQRNALVSGMWLLLLPMEPFSLMCLVFLRFLESYEGVLFLTTNRTGGFDEAFKSRIHLTLYFPPLKWPQTQKIWESHIRRAAAQNDQIDINVAELLRYAKDLYLRQEIVKELGSVWNGRQIRNAFQNAIALASFKPKAGVRTKLTKEYFEKVASISNHPNNSPWSVRKG